MISGEMPKGQKRKKVSKESDEDEDDGPADRFRRGEDVPSDYEIASQSDDDGDFDAINVNRIRNSRKFDPDPEEEEDEEDEEDDILGAQLEREFLKDCSSRSSFTNE